MLISYLWFVTEIRKQDDNMQGRTTSSGENEKRIPRVYWDAQDHDAAAMVTGQLAAENVALRVHPGLCRHKVRDEARHRAFEYCIVASNHILTKYVNLKMLTCHWNIAKKGCKKGFHSIVSRGNAQFYMMYGDAWNCIWEKWGRIRMICTQGARWCSQIHALRIHPAEDADKVRHKAGDGALEDGIIAEYHRLVERVTLVRLLRNWKLKFDQELCSLGEQNTVVAQFLLQWSMTDDS